MTDAALATAPVRGERLHPLYLLTGLGKVVRGAWGVLAGGAYLAVQDKLGLALILFGGFVLLSTASLFIRWLTFEFRVEDDQLRIEQGLLNRSSRTIPFDRVTDVDIEQGPIHRVFGLARVRMETGASAAAKDAEGQLDTITLERAQAIREIVRARRGHPSVTSTEIAHDVGDTARPLYAMDRRRVIIAGFFNFSLAVIAALFGASQTLGDVIGFDPFSRSFWLEIFASTGPLRDYVLAHQFVAALGGTILLLIIGVGTGLVRTVLREHGFRLDRTPTGFRRRRGLLTLTDVTIPDRRVQATIMATGPIKRAFGWFTLKLQSLATDGKQGSHVVAPLATELESAEVQHSLSRPIAPADGSWRSLPFEHFLSSAAITVSAGVVALAAALLSPLALVAAAGLGLATLVNWLEWRRSRYALDSDHLFLERGWWRQRRAIVPLRRIQSIDLTENFWTRAFGFVRMQFGVAGGTMLSAFAIDGIGRNEAESLRARLIAQ
ncbi:PH domain-containing protein [Sphingomonas sp. HDW15A]|uniref:PH domain-containing protein n=1 Tax=Sphingomonas sp. HDW15A TaxID=2714942 RepID=UPI00140B18CC|nr:PH domain-containing protein [Sphingomonas sp. HDW15A]QIK95246.1 PH domain-containing protein [Sphingomonas sp. HDW15A]